MSRRKSIERRNQIIIIAAAVLVIAAVIILFGFKNCGRGTEDTSTTSEPTTSSAAANSAKEAIDPLTGLSGYDENMLGNRPVAVVISNAPAARPQWGLCSPDILVEGLVEGGMTRMLGIYSDVSEIPDKVGPIRSARHDFIEIAQGFDAIYIHWGGSKYAYQAIRDSSRNIDDIDGMNGTYFYRDKNRTNVGIEHRGYTTGDSIAKAIKDKGYRTEIDSNYKSILSFNSEGSPQKYKGGTCEKISFKFSGSYARKFLYDSDEKVYYNYFNGIATNDADGKQMSAKNVIILYCGVSSMNDSKGCIDMNLKSGNGVVASNGTYQTITWEKGSYSDSLKLFTSNGDELKLNAGKSYIGFVPTAQSSNTVIA